MDHLARPLFPLLLLALPSCGFQRVEGDKHPDIPVFPEHTNEKIEITRLIDGELSDVRWANGRYYATGIGYSDSLRSVWVLDSTFDSRSLIRVKGTMAGIDEHGAIYLRVVEPIDPYHDVDVGLMKAAPPDFRPVVLPTVIYRWGGDGRTCLLRNSESSAWQPIDSVELARAVDRTINDKVRCALPSGELTVLTYTEVQTAITSSYLIDDRLAELGIPVCPTGLPQHEIGEALEPFDTAVMDYKSSGNHFVGWFNQTVNKYYSIDVAGEQVQFKSTDHVRVLKRTADEVFVFETEWIYRIARRSR